MKLFGGGDKNKSGKGSSNLPANLQDDALKFKVIIDGIEDGVVMVDDQGIIQLMNPGAGIISGWDPEEATGIDVNSVIKLVDDKGQPVTDSNNPLKQVFKSGQSVHGHDVFLLRRDNQQIPVNLNASPLLDDNMAITAAVAIFSNVSQQRAGEQQRADFISTASHEMRTPVAAIEGYLALALNDKVATIDSRARDYLEKAHSSTQHLGQLFQDLLTSARAEDGRLTSHPAVIELGDYLDKLTSDLRLVAEKKGLAMEFTAGHKGTIDATSGQGGERVVRPLFYVYADPDRLREVITNLFDNAVKYTQEGQVTIGLTGNDQVVQCSVTDTGSGIAPEDVPHLFQKFYRVDNSTTRTIGGTGLGLFISRKIIELYNGRIWCESKLGKGSSFYINLPRLSTQKAMELQASTSSANLIKPISTDVTP